MKSYYSLNRMDSVGGAIVEVCKYSIKFICSRLSTLRSFHGNIKSLHDEMEKLTGLKNDVNEEINMGRMEGKCPTEQTNQWLENVNKLELQVQPVLLEAAQINSTTVHGNHLCNNLCRQYQLSQTAGKLCYELKQLMISFNPSRVTTARPPFIKPVVRFQAQTLVGQTAQLRLEQLMVLLDDNRFAKVGIWGMGGVGKTLLAKNLNDKLESSSMTEPFDMVIWISATKDLDLKDLQCQIAQRLNLELDDKESIHRRANRLLEKLLLRKKLLLIFDNVWEKIDLDILGIPQGDVQINCKILVTTRFLDVCRQMMTDTDFKVDVMEEEEAWDLFAKSAGDVVKVEDVYPLAREVARECCGLPLAIITMGKSMRRKMLVQVWKDTLRQLKRSLLQFGSDEVFDSLKLSYYSLPSKILQWCFLYCSLYPENYSITRSDLISCWIGEGLICSYQTFEEGFDNGVALIEHLKDSCMLEQGDAVDTVKLHGVLRDFAIWISSKELESGFSSQCSSSLQAMPDELQESFRRVSFMNNIITQLPHRWRGSSKLNVLFLQGNPLQTIPSGFFQAIRALRVLNLSRTLITSLPTSVLQLTELRALLLRDCYSLEMLPQLGALNELQVLDLCGTRIRELPEEMGRLTSLRKLDLSRTHHLEIINAGSISGLSSLEILDMSYSGFKWDVKRNVVEGGAAFDELITLERLSVLHIRLDTVDCLALCCIWLKQLKQFNIWISPKNCESNYLPVPHDEKRVILRGVNILENGLEVEGLLCPASALDLVACGGINGLSDIVSRKSLNGMSNLKSLTISSCDSIVTLLDGDISSRSTLPNLEHLTLSRLKNLRVMLDGIVSRGCLGRLKTIEVVDCPRLKGLISFTLLRLLPNLEEINVSNCRRMVQLISPTIDCHVMLPKLRVIKLRNMASLRSICAKAVAWQGLEIIEVSNCPKLVKLPVLAYDPLTIREIRGDSKWWNSLRWEFNIDRFILQKQFQACSDSTMLAKDDRW